MARPRTQPLLAALGAAAALAGMLILAPPAVAASLTSVIWTTNKTTTGASSATYTYALTAATASSVSSITMTVPTSTGGTVSLGPVTPALTGGSVALGGGLLTVSFTAMPVAAGQAISIQVNGVTNTGAAGNYTSVITTYNGGTPVDTGTSGTVTLTSGALSGPTWTVSSATTSATGVTYTYGFPALVATVTQITATVPPGTSGTPALGTVSGITLGSVSLSGTTLTMSGVSVDVGAVSIQVTGLTNTSTAGSYTSEMVVTPLIGSAVSGVTAPVTFTGSLSLMSPGALSWSGTITGSSQSLADGTAGHEQFSLDDESGTRAGWNVTVSATTLTTGPASLPNSGTLVFTGSVTSVSAITAPTVTCNLSCTPPVTTVSYPVAITTAASSPAPAKILNASAGSGAGPFTIGGSGSANPAGWWLKIPATAVAGTYTSTITIALTSGP
jgi:hypothetical protein